MNNNQPLADLLRPTSLDEVVGQEHLIGKGKLLTRLAESKKLPNLIFYGPSGVGKTTVARILAKNVGKKLHYLNGTTASTADIKAVIEDTASIDGISGIILYLDEIQYFNKKQQQTLLECIENGSVTLIASTTENPYFYIYNAVLSRSTVFEFKPIPSSEMKKAVKRAFDKSADILGETLEIEEGVVDIISHSCSGDVRKSINAVELLVTAATGFDGVGIITVEDAKQVAQRSSNRYDKDGDVHYNLLSALQKSIRGSDENAAIHYLARLIDSGDLLSPCRRLLVIASEDIGLAYPQAIQIVKACVDSAIQLGLPEGRIPLAQAVILLCTAPKSNSVINSIDAAISDVQNGIYSDVPDHLKDGHYAGAEKLGHAQGYLYPHSFKNHYVKQQYLPDKIKDKTYYDFGDNKTEQAALAYRNKLLSECEK
ncbi:MAG: replication-associated recombination protein A [Oscillospiraceae bacterium]